MLAESNNTRKKKYTDRELFQNKRTTKISALESISSYGESWLAENYGFL